MIPVSFKKVPEFGECKSKFIKAKKHEEKLNQKWRSLSFDEFMNLKMSSFFEDDFRCVIEFQLEGKKMRLVTHEEEFKAAKLNFPTDFVIHVRQILNIWKTVSDYKRDMPRILLPVAILNAEVQ